MAISIYLLLLFPLFISSVASRSIPSPPPSRDGPIQTNGKNYTYVCDPARFADLGFNVSDFRYCDKKLSYRERVKALVQSMTLKEKVGQLGNHAQGADRIGLPPYNWWSEALHGVSWVGRGNETNNNFNGTIKGATSFPTVIVSAASFNESLWKNIGQVVSTEGRAMYNLGQAGLTFWSPNINVVRDPRWGRIMETPGEDPFIVGRYAVNFVRGLQDIEGYEVTDDLNTRPMKVSACCKHFAGYDLDNWFGIDRWHFDARVTEQDMAETFVRPFEMCIKEGDVSSVMCSYNRLNGFPTCMDPRLLSQTFRGEWNLHGYIVTDCSAIEFAQTKSKWLDFTPVEAVAQTFKAGVDLDCGHYYSAYTESAVMQGKVRENSVDTALENNYLVLMRVGYFDGMPAFESLGKNDVCTKENLELAAESARQGIVLLKNENNALPLRKDKHKKLLLTGPHVNATDVMIGNYEGIPCRYIMPLEALSAEAKVVTELGCHLWCWDYKEAASRAKKAANSTDATIIFAGLSRKIEDEANDREDLLLPLNQTIFINDVAKASPGPVVLVIFSAGGIDISFAKENPNIDAIIWAGYPGAEGGRAIADVIYGRYNPGGRLPITWYKNDYVDALPMTSMQLRPIADLGYPGRTYKFFDGETVYPFGHGLSYSKFNYSIRSSTTSINAKLGPYQHCKPLEYKEEASAPPCPAVNIADTECEDEISFEVEVKNTGKVDGSHVVIVYSKAPSEIVGTPLKQVVAFKRVFVQAGGSELVKFNINACKSLGVVDKTAYLVLPSGEHTIVIGDGDDAVSFPVQVKFSYQ